MPPFPKPKFQYDYDLDTEIRHLQAQKTLRHIPEKADSHLLIATWNLANFGVQDRREKDLRLIAEVIGWFDAIALQEVRQNMHHLEELLSLLGAKYAPVYTDTSGNDERMVFLYDSAKLQRRGLVGEVAPYPNELKKIKFASVKETFQGFDRNPFIQSFTWQDFDFCLVNVHLYYGSNKKSKQSMERRQLETFAVARWAEMQDQEKHNAEQHIIVLGDFNLPHMSQDDPIYRALTRYGLIPTEHATLIGATLPSEPQAKTEKVYQYDQIAFLPHVSDRYAKETGTFDFDGALFADLWQEVEQKKKTQAQFNSYVKYYISDHRPLWAKFR
jgi:endonuclease/exonuclease/phosphatase family metal-dependent hydrolase